MEINLKNHADLFHENMNRESNSLVFPQSLYRDFWGKDLIFKQNREFVRAKPNICHDTRNDRRPKSSTFST
jgi:hypothetical protein